VPGHWEGDLVFGRGMSPVATLVERSTRYVLLIALPDGHRAEVVADTLAAAITTLPKQLTRSLTWDQGHEMAQHPPRGRSLQCTNIRILYRRLTALALWLLGFAGSWRGPADGLRPGRTAY
jgi:IS30 family transposase